MSDYTNIKSRLKEQTPFTNILDGELMNDVLAAINELCAENEKLRDAYDTDALTISYNLGYTCGKDIAKDEIERLRAENEKLRKALKPFADAVKDECNWKYDINVDDFRAAAAAIKDTDNGSV